MLGWTGGGAEGWGSGSEAQASKGICSLSKDVSAPGLLQARGLICNRIHTSEGARGAQHPQENPQRLAAGAAMEMERERWPSGHQLLPKSHHGPMPPGRSRAPPAAGERRGEGGKLGGGEMEKGGGERGSA